MQRMCSLLLVDDDDEFLEILVRRFSRRGMQVAGAASAQAAINTACQQEFHVAVVDRSLPGQDGVELMVRLHDRQPDLRVILLSGHGDEPDISEARARGAFDYLVKPCSLADLEAAVIRAYRSLAP
jgi:DNA-binding NtrC family response regulator